MMVCTLRVRIFIMIIQYGVHIVAYDKMFQYIRRAILYELADTNHHPRWRRTCRLINASCVNNAIWGTLYVIILYCLSKRMYIFTYLCCVHFTLILIIFVVGGGCFYPGDLNFLSGVIELFILDSVFYIV